MTTTIYYCIALYSCITLSCMAFPFALSIRLRTYCVYINGNYRHGLWILRRLDKSIQTVYVYYKIIHLLVNYKFGFCVLLQSPADTMTNLNILHSGSIYPNVFWTINRIHVYKVEHVFITINKKYLWWIKHLDLKKYTT